MPLYSYHCTKCDKEFELLMSSTDVAVCPACGSKKLERLVSRTAPESKLKKVAKAWRARAAREGDMSNFSKAERNRALKG